MPAATNSHSIGHTSSPLAWRLYRVDMISAIPTITTAMLLRQYFTLTFMTVYLLSAR